MRLLLDDFIYKEHILNSSLKKFMYFPSINLSKERYSLRLLDKIMRNKEEIVNEDIEQLFKKNIEKYMRLFEFF